MFSPPITNPRVHHVFNRFYLLFRPSDSLLPPILNGIDGLERIHCWRQRREYFSWRITTHLLDYFEDFYEQLLHREGYRAIHENFENAGDALRLGYRKHNPVEWYTVGISEYTDLR